MNRLDSLAKSKSPLLACYLPFGDPSVPDETARIYADNGVDILEYGMPCSNPYVDGPTVASSMKRAFANKQSAEKLSHNLVEYRELAPESAVILMGYADEMQTDELIADVGDSIDGILCLGGNDKMNVSWRSAKGIVHRILFLPRDLPEEKLVLADSSSGYIMLQSSAGKTGSRSSMPDSCEQVSKVKERSGQTPVLLGFGISTANQAVRAVDMGADGVVIGSAILDVLLNEGCQALDRYLKAVRGALDAY